MSAFAEISLRLFSRIAQYVVDFAPTYFFGTYGAMR
jgi:hypothetical protein